MEDLHQPRHDADAAPPLQIRPATLLDLQFVLALQAINSNHVGFIPRVGIHAYITAHNVTLATLDNRPVAYILGRPKLAWQPLLRPITQICVAETHRRSKIAAALIEHATAAAIAAEQVGLQACCREDLDANAFWIRKGFVKICYMSPPNARRKDIIVWRKPLTRKIPLWFANPPMRAGHRATRPTVNTRQRRPNAS